MIFSSIFIFRLSAIYNAISVPNINIRPLVYNVIIIYAFHHPDCAAVCDNTQLAVSYNTLFKYKHIAR